SLPCFSVIAILVTPGIGRHGSYEVIGAWPRTQIAGFEFRLPSARYGTWRRAQPWGPFSRRKGHTPQGSRRTARRFPREYTLRKRPDRARDTPPNAVLDIRFVSGAVHG